MLLHKTFKKLDVPYIEVIRDLHSLAIRLHQRCNPEGYFTHFQENTEADTNDERIFYYI